MALDWTDVFAPSLADIEALAEAALTRLPEYFRAFCEGLVIKVDDFPDEETLDTMDAETEFDLLGLFAGQGLSQGEPLSQTGTMPNMVWLYRRPILDYWAEHDETLGAIVTHVLVHEIGHHFGLSDADMAAAERSARLKRALFSAIRPRILPGELNLSRIRHIFPLFAPAREPIGDEELTSTVLSETGQGPPLPAAASVDSGTGSLVRNVLASLDDAKAEGVVAIDVLGKTTLADVMVIATGRSNTHVGAIAERVIKSCKERGLTPRVEGVPNCDWVLVDAGDVIVHVFRLEVRQFYNLEKMWGGDRPAERSALRVV